LKRKTPEEIKFLIYQKQNLLAQIEGLEKTKEARALKVYLIFNGLL